MLFRSIRWRIAVPYLILLAVLLSGTAFFMQSQIKRVYLERLEAQLTGEARLLAEMLTPMFQQPDPDMDAIARRYADSLGTRVTFINRAGDVWGESHEDRTIMDNHLYRPEIQRALSSQVSGTSIRYSRTVAYNMLYVAVPVVKDGAVLGFVRLAVPLKAIDAQLVSLNRMSGGAILLVLLLAFVLALLIASRTVVPIQQLTTMAQRLREGDLNARLVPITRDELRTLTLAFNEMAERLQDQVAMLRREQALLSALFASLADGLLVVDANGTIQMSNMSVARLLNMPAEDLNGRFLPDVLRHHRLIGLWHEVLETQREVQDAVELSSGTYVQAMMTPLAEGDSRDLYLVLLQDLTRLRRLELVRRDFVANVSHELRTPLASLKTLVQTLQEGACQDPAVAPQFLAQIEDQVDLLIQMVEELLELSRLESGRAPLRFAPVPITALIDPVIARLRPQAERAQLTLDVDLPEGLPPVWADPERAQQIFVNLIHNAIKFTPAGGWIRITAEQKEEMLAISVADNGIGIPADDLDRIFERFYKSDRARNTPGTGLGLAIVRHIVQAHGGQIEVQSREGEGSVFTVMLPVESLRA